MKNFSIIQFNRPRVSLKARLLARQLSLQLNTVVGRNQLSLWWVKTDTLGFFLACATQMSIFGSIAVNMMPSVINSLTRAHSAIAHLLVFQIRDTYATKLLLRKRYFFSRSLVEVTLQKAGVV